MSVPLMFRVVIPARYGSSRLPGKPLLLIGGRPMLQWVLRTRPGVGRRTVVIATDDDRIADAATLFGAAVQLTSLTHVSGTDRIAEVALQAGWDQDDVIVNLQGDEPMMPSSLVRQVALLLEQQPLPISPRWRRGSPALPPSWTPIPSRWSLTRPVARCISAGHRFPGGAIPRPPAWPASAALRPRAGISGSTRIASPRCGACRCLQPSPLELVEKLEQLRALENGMEIRVADAAESPGPDVNTAEDLARVALLLGARGN